MKLLLIILLATCSAALAQPSYWFSQFEKQGNALLAQQFQYRAGTNISFTYTNPPSPYVYINASGAGGNGLTTNLCVVFCDGSTNALFFVGGVLVGINTPPPSGHLIQPAGLGYLLQPGGGKLLLP